MDEKKHTADLPYRVDVERQPGDIVFCTDAAGLVSYWSEEAVRALGFAPDEAVGRPLNEVLDCSGEGAPLDVAGVIAGRDHAAGVECRKRSGQSIALYVFGTPGRDAAGKRVGAVFYARDVTEFWRAEEALRSSQGWYRLLFENMTDSVAIADINGRVLEVNPACLRLYGYTVDEARRLNLVDIVAPESRADAAAAMASLAAGGTVATTIEVRRKDGTQFTAELLAYVTTDAAGERRIYSFTRDVTEQRLAARRTAASESKYRQMFDATPDAMLLETLDGRIVEVNNSACRLLGYSRAELLSLKVEDLTPAEVHDWLPSVRELLAAGKPFRAETKNRRKDGTLVEVDLSVTTITVDDEQIFLAVLRDIGPRKLAEAALRANVELYRTVFENTGAATIIIEADTTVSRVNDEFARLFGFGRDEVVGQSWTVFVHPDDLPRMKEYHQLRRVDPLSAPHSYEFRLLDKFGQIRECFLFIDMIPGTGRSVASMLDFTEPKRVERELAESRQRYRDLFHSFVIGVYRTTPDGRVLMANPALVKMLGYDSYAEFVSRNLEKGGFEPSYPRQQFKELMERSGAVRGLESAWKTRDGRTIHVRESATAVRDQTGTIVYYDGSVEDVTERKAIEERVRAREAELRDLRDNLPIGVYQTTPEGRFLSVNRGMVRMLGYASAEELLATSVVEVYADPGQRAGALKELDERGRLDDFHITAKRKDNTVFTARLNVRAVPGPDGKPSHYDGTIQDETRIAALQAELAESAANFHALVDNATDGIAVLDASGTIVLANPRAAVLLGYPVAELVGAGFGRFLRPDAVASLEEQMARRLRGEPVPSHYEVPLVRKDGSPTRVEVSVSATTWKREPAIIAVVRDASGPGAAEHRRSGMSYRAALDALVDPVYVTDRAGTILMANLALVDWLRSFGLPADVVGRSLEEALPFLSAAALEDHRQVTATGRVSETQEAGTVAGRMVVLGVTRVPVVEGGEVSQVVTAMRDVSRRRAEQELLREKEEQFRRLVELSPDGIAVHQDGRVVMANDAAARILGYASGRDALGQPVLDFVHPEDRALVAARVRRVMEEGTPGQRVGERFIRSDGSEVAVEVANAPFVWRGRPAVQVVFRDVSEQQRLARMADEASTEFRAILDNAPEGVVAECDGRVVYCNSVFVRMFGYDSPSQVVGMPAEVFDAPEERERLAGYSRARLRGEPAPTCYTFTGLRRDGSRAALAASVSCYRLGDREYVLGFVRELPPGRCGQNG